MSQFLVMNLVENFFVPPRVSCRFVNRLSKIRILSKRYGKNTIPQPTMNRVTRLIAGSLRKPTLRYLSSCILTCPASLEPLPLLYGYSRTICCVVGIVLAAYLGGSYLGVKGLLMIWLLAEVLFVFVNAAR